MSDENKSQPPKAEVPRPAVKPATPEVKPPPAPVAPEKNDDDLEIEEIKDTPKEEVKKPPLLDVDKEPAHPELFELRLTENEVQTGSIPITWCIDRKWAEENYGKNCWVLIAVAPPRKSGKTAEWRGWARLTDMMAFITFYRPGKNRIMARVTKSKSDIEQWMERSDGTWKYDVFNFPNDWESEDSSKYLRAKIWVDSRLWNYMDVDLPAECFAKEPPEWEKTWVNFFFKKKSVDQCEYRKRRMFAYSLQPIAVLIIALLYLVVTGGIQLFNLFIGKWTKWSNWGTGDVEIDGRINYLTVKHFDKLSWIFIPIPLVLFVGFLLLKILHIKKWLFIMLALAPTYIAAVLVSWGIMLLLAVIFSKFIKMYENSAPGRRDARERAAEEKRLREEALRRAELEFILCSAARIKNIKDLPKNKRTVKLRFQDLKSMVCKPFAR